MTATTGAPKGSRDIPFDDVRRHAVGEFAAQHADLEVAASAYVELITEMLDDAGINYLSVTGRTKTVQSFAAKAIRTTADGDPLYADPLRGITDSIGVRVITYVSRDVDAVAELLREELVVLDDRDLGQVTAEEGRFGYASRHLLVRGSDVSAPATDADIPRDASVQVRTVLQHAWAEFEHDIRYKGTVPAEHAPDFDRRFTLAAGLLEVADREFSEIRDRVQQHAGTSALAPGDGDPRISAQDLAAFLAGRFPSAGWSRTDHYAWISGLVLELGIASLKELEEVLSAVDPEAINAAMDYRYPPGAVRRLDDALLARFAEGYIELRANAHRRPLLETRLAKMRTQG